MRPVPNGTALRTPTSYATVATLVTLDSSYFVVLDGRQMQLFGKIVIK